MPNPKLLNQLLHSLTTAQYVPRSRIRALGYADMKTARAALYRRAKVSDLFQGVVWSWVQF